MDSWDLVCDLTYYNSLVGPYTPVLINTSTFRDLDELSVTFDWDQSERGGGAAGVVDAYYFTISPTPLFLMVDGPILLTVPTLEVLLEYDVAYDLNITAVNCVGSSVIVQTIEFGKFRMK